MSDPKRLPSGVASLAHLFCGCATDGNTWSIIIDELERLDRKEYRGNDGLAAAIVDYFGLSEHGVSVRGGWLTPKGKEALAFLRQHGADWQDKGEFVDDDGVHYGGEP